MAHPLPVPGDFTFAPSLSNFDVTKKAYLSNYNETDPTKKFDGVAVGALIFSNHYPQHPDRILLVKRASHDSMPNKWEIPGGAVDPGETILYGLVREAWEESGMRVKRVEALVGDGNGDVFHTTRGKRISKFTFAVEAENTDGVKLDPNEHQDYVWATEDECRAKKAEREGGVVELEFTTPAQEAAILNGLAWRKAARGA